MKRKLKWIRYVLLLVAVTMIYNVFSGPSGVVNILRLHLDNKEKSRKIDSLVQSQRDLILESERLKKDTAYLEMMARKEMGMAHPDEQVFRFVPEVEKGRQDGEKRSNQKKDLLNQVDSEPRRP